MQSTHQTCRGAATPFVHGWQVSAVLGALLGCGLLPSPALAQERRSGDHVVLGAGMASVPDYQGSDDNRIIPVPIIDVQQGRLFASTANGVGMDLVRGPLIDAGVSATFVPGYRRRDVPQGIDRVDAGMGVRGFVRLHTGRVLLNTAVTKVVAGSTGGLLVDAWASYPIPVSPRLTVVPTISTSWANGRHNDRYFGVNAAESIASGLPSYAPGAGFKDVAAAATAMYSLTPRVTLTGNVSLTRSIGDVVDSPLVERKTRPSGFLGIAYRL